MFPETDTTHWFSVVVSRRAGCCWGVILWMLIISEIRGKGLENRSLPRFFFYSFCSNIKQNKKPKIPICWLVACNMLARFLANVGQIWKQIYSLHILLLFATNVWEWVKYYYSLIFRQKINYSLILNNNSILIEFLNEFWIWLNIFGLRHSLFFWLWLLVL